MRNITISILLATFAGCSSDNGTPPPISTGSNSNSETGDPTTATTGGPGGSGEGSGEGSTTGGPTTNTNTATVTQTASSDTTTGESQSGTGSSSGTPPDIGEGSSSTGDACPEWGRYQCRGWAAGLYCRENLDACDVSGYHFEINGQETVECIDDIEICMPYVGEEDSAFLYDACREACEAQVWDWPDVHPGSTTIDFVESGITVCVFADDGAGGYVPAAQEPVDEPAGLNIGVVTTCDWVNQAPPVEPQTIYLEPCDNEECQDTSVCEKWEDDVDAYVNNTFRTLTKTYTTTIKLAFLASVADERYADYYACDEGRYHESINGGVSSWGVKDSVAGELLYEMGFRHGDYMVKIAWSGTPGAWVYLDSYEDMADFFDLHRDKNSFKIEFLRGLVVYKMNLTLN